ncbi:MAG: magnesium/cobalt transporter CorA [Acidimicrobiia bacterium]|nr:magnesium/cobalt transporter CorA [Acidimicrobiia bacterium]
MIRVYSTDDHRLVEATDIDLNTLGSAVWVELSAPSAAECRAVVERFGEILPQYADAGEIEATSRYFEDEDAVQIQLNFLDHSGQSIKNMNVAFAWRGGPLLSLHERDLVAAQMFRRRAEYQPELAGNSMSVFLGILESKVDHLADVLESTYERLEKLSRSVVNEAEADLQSDLVALAEVEDQNGKIRLNLMDTQRVLTSLLRSDKFSDGNHRLGEVLRDVESLLSHTAFLLEEISLLSDTIIGLINIEQNQIVKALSIVATVFLPPTLVASLYGMNFRHMPELSWVFGYPIAIVLMVILGVTPYLYAKRRGWM